MTEKHANAGVGAIVGGLAWLAALLGFGAMLDGYSHAQHPIALPGAQGVDHALAFNALAFVLPGLLVAWSTLRLRNALGDAGWMARIGAHLWLLSALAFAAQGVFPLDPEELDAGTSRLHATVWSLWWIAFLPGALLLSLHRRAIAIALLVATVITVVAVVLLPAGIAQRLAVAVWFGLVAYTGFRLGRAPRATPAAEH